MDFWRSTHKILATSKSSYEKITGKKFTGTADDLMNNELNVSTANDSVQLMETVIKLFFDSELPPLINELTFSY